MDHHALHELIAQVKAGRLDRRAFVQTMVGLGLTAPLAAQMLASAGVAHAQPKAPAFTPTKRGGGGLLKTLWWQAPTLLNPHFATGTKDQDASRIFYEPLAGFDPDGNVIPVLAAETPSVQNGGLARDLTSVTWRLKKGVTWHDGKPVTADDVIFTYEFVVRPGHRRGEQRLVPRDREDRQARQPHRQAHLHQAPAVLGGSLLRRPRHDHPQARLRALPGGQEPEAPANLKPVGTGPYRLVDFKPGDTVRGEANPAYHVPNRPFFDAIEMKGGGDAASAARAVLQTGEYDYAWNLQVEDDILRRMEQGGKGRVNIWPTGNPEHMQCNFSDPWTEVDGERSHAKTTHPVLSDPAVRQALNLLVDRAAVQEEIYGRRRADQRELPQRAVALLLEEHPLGVQRGQGQPGPRRGRLEAGRRRHPGQGRQAAEVRLPDLHQRPAAEEPGHRQAGGGQGGHRDGDQVGGGLGLLLLRPREPRHLPALLRGPADVQHHHVRARTPQYFMNQFCSWEVSQKANKWQGRNVTRFRSDEYDRTYKAADGEIDPVKRAALFIKMNDIVIANVVVIPVLWRNGVSGSSTALMGMDLTGWDSTFWRLPYWYKQA